MQLLTQASIRSLAFKVVTCRVRGVEVQIEISSPIERYRADTYSTKEPETLDWLEQNLRPNDVFLDVGANIGLYSLFAAKLGRDCTVYAFEPESQNFGRLCRNLALNEATNVIPCNCALSNREAFDFFYVGELQAGAALHSLGRPSALRAGTGAPVLRQGTIAVTLDALVNRYGLPQPNLLKIDVDGGEDDILAGAETVLKSAGLRTILVEVNVREGESSPGPERRLLQAGYRVSARGLSAQELNGTLSRNYIFERG
nr:FkbM family methyltransferase [Nitrospirota bacterium]